MSVCLEWDTILRGTDSLAENPGEEAALCSSLAESRGVAEPGATV